MQTKTTIKVLAINPGTRYMGFAVFHGPELRDWGTKVVKGKWSSKKKEKLKNIVLSLIDLQQPDAIAIKKLHPSRSSRQLDSFVDSIRLMVEKSGLPFYEYPIKYLKSCLSSRAPTNKMHLAQLLVQRYPALYNELKREQSTNRYYSWMFDAVATGTVCFKQLDRLQSKKSLRA